MIAAGPNTSTSPAQTSASSVRRAPAWWLDRWAASAAVLLVAPVLCLFVLAIAGTDPPTTGCVPENPEPGEQPAAFGMLCLFGLAPASSLIWTVRTTGRRWLAVLLIVGLAAVISFVAGELMV